MIMLDEPFAGIDPKTVAEIQDQIRALVEQYNIGILLTDHQFRETLEVTDRCYVISEGRVFAYGNREQILNNPEVRRRYIGERFDVGHLLDRRRPASLPHTSPPRPTRPIPVTTPDRSHEHVVVSCCPDRRSAPTPTSASSTSTPSSTAEPLRSSTKPKRPIRPESQSSDEDWD